MYVRPLLYHHNQNHIYLPPCTIEAKECMELYTHEHHTSSRRGALSRIGGKITLFLHNTGVCHDVFCVTITVTTTTV